MSRALAVWLRIKAGLALRQAKKDWNAALEQDRRVREALIGKPFAKRRAAALKGLNRG